MTDQPYTPTTTELIAAYDTERQNDTFDSTWEKSKAEFFRWFRAKITAELAAAEQRGAARGKIEGLREAATSIRDSKFANSVKPPSKKVQVKEADWLDALADRLEADGETH